MSLKNLLALQAKKQASGAATPKAEPKAEAPQVESVAPTSEATPKAAQGFSFGAVKKPGAGFKPPVKSAAPKPVTPKPEPISELSDDFSLDDLANLDVNEIDPSEKRNLGSGFEDEIDATAPDRILDPSLTKQQLDFVQSLDGIYEVLHDPDMFGQSVRIIMLEMAENKEYKKLITDEDVHVIIRGMRNTMGLAKIKKQEKSRKNATPKTKAARGKAAVGEDDMAMLESLFDGDD